MVSPFGSNLTFSAYEQSKKEELSKAKPTPIAEEKEEDIDFDSLL